ncbi:hypothetical protein AAE478_005011 [Parahypoxylon ruwenzoriense]
MVVVRVSNSLSFLRVARARAPLPQAYRAFITTPLSSSQQGYGDGKGDPVGENPQQQPPSSGAQQASEHPGPEPPDVGKGTGGGPTKAGISESMKQAAARAKSFEDASAQSGGSRSKEATETGSSPTGGEIANAAPQSGGEALKGPQGQGKPRPKIHNQSVPGAKPGLNDEQKREVERHNQDFEKRHDRASPASEDKVDKKFWRGTGGRQGDDIDWDA